MIVYNFRSLTSTQDKARELAKKGIGTAIIIAGVQTKGRGRFGRKWHSGKNGLWMSFLLKPDDTQHLQYLTFAAAISVAKSIEKIAEINTSIKWPNDVHYKGKKLCGILTENVFGKENHVIVGIGLNVNNDKFPPDIRNIATSIKIINNKKTSINDLSKSIIDEFLKIYENQYNKNKLYAIMKEWKKYCDTIGKKISVIMKNGTLRGKAMGVDENCSLLLRLDNGKIIKVIEGDIKVRY